MKKSNYMSGLNSGIVDLSFIGKEGMIIQYEDIISLVGFNIVKYLRKKEVSNKICKMSIKDILLSYFNRETENVGDWLQRNFDINNFDINDYNESVNTYVPTTLYAYKLFQESYKNGVNTLIIHSNKYSDVIKKFVEMFDVPVQYTYGDVCKVLEANPNSTYITSSTENIKKCLTIKKPIALTIIDDYMYIAPLLTDGTIDKLRENNIFVQFSSILSGGFIPCGDD